MVLQADTDADAVEDADEDENTNPPGATTLEVRDREGILGTITLERHVDPAWGEVCDHLRQMGITVVPLEAPESAADDVAWRLEAVLALQRQGRVVAWLGDELADIPAMTRAEVAIGLPSAQGHLLPSSLLDLTVGQDPRWLPRLVALSRDLAGASRANLWLIGLTHVLSSLASAGLAVTPLQMVVLADLPLLLAELNNRRASARKMGRTPAFSLRSWAPL
jgi:cation transport ATPase